MRAVILAAGSGRRMGKYGENLPKGMLPINGKSIIEWQIGKLREIGISDIVIVTGYKAEMITFEGITYFHNPAFADTNMVETLMCAREAFDTDILVSYADIVCTRKLVAMVAGCGYDIGVAIDEGWRDYWMLRYGTTETDLETLIVSEDGKITCIGKPVSSSEGLNYRYIGLIKFSVGGISSAMELYNWKKRRNENWIQSGKPFAMGYMTDLLHELIIRGQMVYPVITRGGWLEFDTVEDYEKALHMSGSDTLSNLINL
jgi:choline kinase